MRAVVAASILLLACTPTVTRTLVVDPHTAATLGSHVTKIFSMNTRKVEVEATFKPGDTIPGEGVVRARVSWQTFGLGAALTTAGFGIIALEATCGSNDSSGILFPGSCKASYAVMGALVAVPGMLLTIGSLNSEAYVDRSRVTIVPSITQHGASASFAVRF